MNRELKKVKFALQSISVVIFLLLCTGCSSKSESRQNVEENGLTPKTENVSGQTRVVSASKGFYRIEDNKKFGIISDRNGSRKIIVPAEYDEIIWRNWKTGSDLYFIGNKNGLFSLFSEKGDKLLSDCGYQGINLLKGGNLKLTFDENREHKFNVLGQDISSVQLGINEALWQNQGDINTSIDELKTAITTLRSLAEELGNQYSVIKTRINFTEGLSDILQTGADDLTLADMNEASAQYLSLQTRQQLAINSLSLAAQSASSVLSLF